MRQYLILFSVFLFFACKTTKKVVNSNDTLKNFPAAWAGNWEGTLDIYSAKGKLQSLSMEVEIKKIDTSATRYTFALIYGEDKIKGRRAYEMYPKDSAQGIFINDEKNTILMEEYFLNNKLYCWFEVQGTLLLSVFEKKGEYLYFDIISGKSAPVSTTGGQKVADEDIPVVKTFPVRGVQSAILKKKK